MTPRDDLDRDLAEALGRLRWAEGSLRTLDGLPEMARKGMVARVRIARNTVRTVLLLLGDLAPAPTTDPAS